MSTAPDEPGEREQTQAAQLAALQQPILNKEEPSEDLLQAAERLLRQAGVRGWKRKPDGSSSGTSSDSCTSDSSSSSSSSGDSSRGRSRRGDGGSAKRRHVHKRRRQSSSSRKDKERRRMKSKGHGKDKHSKYSRSSERKERGTRDALNDKPAIKSVLQLREERMQREQQERGRERRLLLGAR